jgi:thioredoxin-related protein
MTPTISFIDLDGAEIYRHTGMVKTGEEFLIMGEYIAGQHYFDTEFKVYAKMRGSKNPGDVLVTQAKESSN